jgi:hypothetical protein
VTNVGPINFNIATQIEGALDKFIITPTTSIYYHNEGIGKSPSVALGISGHLNATGNVYTQLVQPLNDNTPKAMNIRTRLTKNLNLSSETGNIDLITNSINRFRIDPSGNVDSYGTLDVSGNIKGLDIYEKKNIINN